MLVGSGWNRLPCGAAVLADEDGQPVQVCDLGMATLDIDEGVFAGDQEFADMLADELSALGWSVMLDTWEPTDEALRCALALALDDDGLGERASFVADVLRSEPVAPATPPLREVPGLEGVLVDRYGAFVVRCEGAGQRELPMTESGGVLEVEVDGQVWCVDELTRRAWDDDV
ncbi:MAG: hypothetical protein AB1Z98_06140, partial [Nannocystaceae bacterium]